MSICETSFGQDITIARDVLVGGNTTITGSGQFIGSGAGITNIPLSSLAAGTPLGGLVLFNPTSGLIQGSSQICQDTSNNVLVNATKFEVLCPITYDANNKTQQVFGAVTTSNATATVIATITLPPLSTTQFKYDIAGNNTSSQGNSVTLSGYFRAYQSTSGSSPTLGGITAQTKMNDLSMLLCTMSKSAIANACQITVSGLAGTNINWTCLVSVISAV